jgi:hypothetical protein
MKQELRRRTWLVVGLSATLMGGLITSGVTAAEAAPRYRVYNRDQDYRGHDRDRDGIPNYRDRDRDGDGVPNFRDTHPNTPDRYRYERPRYDRLRYRDRDRDWEGDRDWDRDRDRDRNWDRDRDGIPNYRDRDRDGDGVPDWRDRHPNDRRRR